LLEDFFQDIINLKNIQRKGWKNQLDLKNPESVADHSYSVTLMAMILSEIQKLDTNKIVKMSLLHDLAESEVGDFIPGEISKEKKIALENDAMDKILSKIPTPQSDNYKKIWDEYQANQSKESKFVHDVDKFEMVFQARNYLKKGSSKEKIQSFIDTADKEITNKQLRQIISNLFND
jgi:putative hydrolase of HD superfamily